MNVLVTVLMLAAMHQAESRTPPALATAFTAGTCELTTPTGRVVRFTTAADNSVATSIIMTPQSGSEWPATPQLAVSSNISNPSPFPGETFTVGAERSGYLLHVVSRAGGLRPSTIYLRHRREVALPVAFGFCRQASSAPGSSSVVTATGADSDPLSTIGWAFDDSCALLQLNGTRSRLQQTSQRGGLQFSSSVEQLLATPAATFTATSAGQGGLALRVTRLAVANSASAVAMDYVNATDSDGDVGITLLQFSRFGGTSEASRQPGFAMCPFRVTRRARIG